MWSALVVAIIAVSMFVWKKMHSACRCPSRAYWVDKHVWVTGATSGLGESIANELLTLGARVTMSARREEELRRVAGGWGESAIVLPLDLSADHEMLVAKAAEVGEVDVFIANAGVGFRGDCEGTVNKAHRKVMATNFESFVSLVGTLLPRMKARAGSGHQCAIVAVSSVQAFVGQPLRSSYVASKHALRAYLDSLRAELRGGYSGISVTNVCPGYISTNHSKAALNADGSFYGKTDHATAHGVAPADVARELLLAVEDGAAEVVHAPCWMKAALLVRAMFPDLMFWYMAKKAKKLSTEA